MILLLACAAAVPVLLLCRGAAFLLRKLPLRATLAVLLAALCGSTAFHARQLYRHWWWIDLSQFPCAQVVAELPSPDGRYTLLLTALSREPGGHPVYLHGAVLDHTAPQEGPGDARTIYWDRLSTPAAGYIDPVSAQWAGPDTVIIERRRLSVPAERYDYRHDRRNWPANLDDMVPGA